MPKRQVIGIVTKDRMDKTRRVEIARLVKHPKYGKFMRRRTVCHVHDEDNTSKLGDTVEIIECPPKSRTKRWALLRVVQESQLVDLAAMRASHRLMEEQRAEGEGEETASAGEAPAAPEAGGISTPGGDEV